GSDSMLAEPPGGVKPPGREGGSGGRDGSAGNSGRTWVRPDELLALGPLGGVVVADLVGRVERVLPDLERYAPDQALAVEQIELGPVHELLGPHPLGQAVGRGGLVDEQREGLVHRLLTGAGRARLEPR